jgi:hypothetical protein
MPGQLPDCRTSRSGINSVGVALGSHALGVSPEKPGGPRPADCGWPGFRSDRPTQPPRSDLADNRTRFRARSFPDAGPAMPKKCMLPGAFRLLFRPIFAKLQTSCAAEPSKMPSAGNSPPEPVAEAVPQLESWEQCDFGAGSEDLPLQHRQGGARSCDPPRVRVSAFNGWFGGPRVTACGRRVRPFAFRKSSPWSEDRRCRPVAALLQAPWKQPGQRTSGLSYRGQT